MQDLPADARSYLWGVKGTKPQARIRVTAYGYKGGMEQDMSDTTFYYQISR